MNASVSVSLEELIRLKVDARGFSFLPRQPVNSLLSGRYASRLRGRGLAFEELRHYAQGDDVRTIDWRATARLRSPYVRVYSEERERPVLLVVDQRSPMFFGSQRAMKSVAAAEVAALAAWRSLQVGDRVGGVFFNDSRIVDIRPQRSQTAVLRILHELVRQNNALRDPVADGQPGATLNDALTVALRRATHDHLVVIVSDLDGADMETQRLATNLVRHNDVLMVAVYDPLGGALQNHPGMLASTQAGLVSLPGDRGFPDAFQQTFSKILGQWCEIFRALRVPVLPISAAEPPVDQLRALFGQPFSAEG